MRRPNLTVDDAKAIEKLAPSVQIVDIWLGARAKSRSAIFYEGQKTRAAVGRGSDRGVRQRQLRARS